MTIREALAEGSAALRAAGVETPALDASLLLAKVLSCSRASLLASGPEPLALSAYTAFKKFLERRSNGECTAYLLGKKEFRSLEFTVSPAVLVPRPDTETLVEAALAFAHNTAGRSGHQPCRIFDLCTGSGAIAISLKHEMPALEVWAGDISAEALAIAKANAACHNISITFLQSDLFEALPPDSRFSLIVSNPPYIPHDEIKKLPPEVQKEPLVALDGGSAGLAIIKKIIAASPDFLLPGGALFLEADPEQMKTIAVLLAEQGFVAVKTYKDLSGKDRVIIGEWGS